MKNIMITMILLVMNFSAMANENNVSNACPAFLAEKVNRLNSSEQVDLCEVTKGKVVLVVNTASHCGFTPQFKALEALHQQYKSQNLVVLGFPSDDFFQEENEQDKIADICFVNYGVNFIMLEPVHVWGNNAHTIFRHLAEKSATPKWNFYKYVVSDNWENVQVFNSKVKPDDASLVIAIESALKKNNI